MDLYHASKSKFSVGDIIKGNNTSNFYLIATTAMDSQKPDGLPARKTALYCTDSPEFAVYYLRMQEVDINQINLYRVHVSAHHKAPFSITHVLENKIKANIDVTELINEYWSPSKDWNYYEYLTEEFEVKEIIDKPKLNEILISHEPPRVLRRLQHLREWSHEQVKQVFT